MISVEESPSQQQPGKISTGKHIDYILQISNFHGSMKLCKYLIVHIWIK
jgi:hypothetical protein